MKKFKKHRIKLYPTKCQKCKQQVKNRDRQQHCNSKCKSRGEEQRSRAEQRRIEKSNIYFSQMQPNVLTKFLAKLRYNKYDLERFYKLNETAQGKVSKPYGDTKNTEIREVVKQDNICTHYVPCINSKSK